MDKPSPNNPHLHDWLGTQTFAAKPFDPMSLDPKQMLEGLSAGFGPMKALTVQQVELIRLASRRAQAYLSIPQRLSRCRTHSDLVNEQMLFWQAAMGQYQDATTRIANAWSELFAALPQAPGGPVAPSAPVTFPKPVAVHSAPSNAGKAGGVRRPAPVNGKA
jgi:hypothetical protein